LSLGAIKGNFNDPITAIAAAKSGNDVRITGLKDGKLFQRKLFGQNEADRAWAPVYDGANPLFATISAVRKPGTLATVADDANGLVALDQLGNLYDLRNGITTPVTVTSFLDTTVQPLAVMSSGQVLVAAISTDHQNIFAIAYDPSPPAAAPAPNETLGKL